MADVRCPMCSKPNPAGSDSCRFCGARIKPLIVDAGQAAPAPPPQDAGADWLARLRPAEPEQEGPPEGARAGGAQPDWLERLRPAEPEEEGPPEGALPDWLEGPAESAPGEPAGDAPVLAEPAAPDAVPADDVPDWLARIRERRQAETEAAPAPQAAPEPDDWLARLRGGEAPAGEEPAAAADDWLERLREEPAAAAPEPARPAEPPDEIGPLPWETGEQQAEAGLWEAEPAEPEPTSWEPAAPAGPTEWPPRAGPELPPWPPRAEAEAPAQEPAAPRPSGPVTPPFIPAFSKQADGEDFTWLGDEAPSGAPPAPAPAPQPERPPERPGRPSGLGADSMPAWYREIEAAPPSGPLPKVPALVTGEDAPEPPSAAPELELGKIDLPDWLSELKRQAPEAEPGRPSVRPPDLAPATLPAWLEAMRPMETFRPVVEIQAEEERSVESAGPLAGLRGVLLAEPTIAQPREPALGGPRVDLTERHHALSELLHRMVEEEQREGPPPQRRRPRLPLTRWAVALALVLAVALPPLFGAPSFPAPTLVPPGLSELISLIGQLPEDGPVLLVFEYEPAYAGELEAVSGPLLEHLMIRRLPLVTVSTRPSGPPLAERALRLAGARHGYVNGEQYVHLGYLPGGPAAVQFFASDPRQAIGHGFALPEATQDDSAWAHLRALEPVQDLSDFGAVVVLAASTELARTWVEQASPRLGGTPLVMVLSAGVEPLVRPYYESTQPQVDGILSGMRTAVAYEQFHNQAGAARGLWDAFGSGLLVAELALLFGGLYGLAVWILRPSGP